MNLSIKELNRHFEEGHLKKDDIIDLCLSEYSKATNDTEKSDFLILIARCFSSKKEPHYANDYLDKAINLKVKTAEALFWKGYIQYEFKNTDSAIALLDESIKTDASFDGSYQVLGVIFRQQGKFNDSKNYCLKGLALNPENAKTHAGLAETLYSLQENDLSEFHLRKAVALGLTFASNTLQTRFKIKTAQERSAYSDYFWDSYSNNGPRAHLKKSVDQLRMIIKKGKDIDDNELSNYCVTFAERSFWEKTDYVEVMSVIEKAIELSPTNAKAYFVWARAIERRNTTDKENIKNLYAKAIELDNTNYKFYSQFAQYEDKNGNKQEAIKLYQKAMDLYGYDARTCENLGVNYAENGQLEKGLELLRRAARYRSSSAESKLKALTIAKLTRPVQGATQEELEKYYLEKEISNLIADAEYEASGSKWPAARYYFHIAKQKLEKEEKIIGGRLDRLLTDVYARIGWCTPAPEGNDWAQKALSKDPIHLGAIHTLAAHNLASNPEKTNELYTKIRELNPYHIAANVQFLATTFKNKDYTEVINVGTNMVQIIEKEYDVLLVEKKSCRIILKQWSDVRWYLAKSFEETGNYVKALEFFELGFFRGDIARVKKLIAAGSNKNNEGFIGWNKMPNRYEIESMIAAYFKQFGSEEHKNTASKVRISDRNLWGLWKETKYNLEAPDGKIDSSFEGNIWKVDASWLNDIKLSNDFNWDDLDDIDLDNDDPEKVEVQTSFYVEVFFKEYISDASIYLDFSIEGREGNYYVECRKITLH